MCYGLLISFEVENSIDKIRKIDKSYLSQRLKKERKIARKDRY